MPAFALGSGVSLKIRIMRLLDASAQPSSHPRRVRAAAMIAAAVLFVVCSAVPSTPKPEQEGGAHPEEVLLRMARAYNQRDLELYKTCFAEGFVYQFEGGQWGPEEDLKATEGMFHNPQIVGVEYVLDLDRATMNEVAPDTWVIDGVSNHLTVHWLDGGKPRDYEFQDTDRWVFTVVWDAVHGYRITHLLDRRTTRK